ncbi:hypothetical protein Tco_0561563 [Tanacetum coccineum]
MDALALTTCYSAFLTTADVLEVYMHQFWNSIHKYDTSYRTWSYWDIKSIIDVVVDQMHQPWRTFATIINRSLSGKTSGLDKLSRLPEAMTSPEMRETKAYKTYLSYATGVTPPKKARKFKKPASPKLTTFPVSPEEPTRKSKRVKRPANKSTNAPTAGVVIRDIPVMSLSKKKEKVTVEKRKGIDLLSKVALTKEAQYEEVRKKSLRDFHKTHPSGSGIVTSAAKIKPSVTNEGTGAKPGVPDVTEEESTESEAESWGRDEDDSNNDRDSRSKGNDQESNSGDDNSQSDKEKGSDSEHETDENETSFESDQEENEEGVEDKAEGDEDKGMDYTTNQFNDDVDVRLNAPINTDEGFIQKEGTDDEMINVQQGNENVEITLNEVIEDAHVTISTITKKTKVPKQVVELKKDDLLNTQVTTLVEEHLDSRVGATRDEFMSYLSSSITAWIIEQVKIQLPQILPKEVSNFAPPVTKSMVIESIEHAVLAKESSQP